MHFAVFMYRTMYKDYPQMQVHFIDVGQGDSILIQSPNGKTMLIDGGTRGAGDDVVTYLKSLGISTFDYVVATHPDADHIGGLIDVFAAFHVHHFVNSGKDHTSETYADLLEAAVNEGSAYIEPNQGDSIALDNAVNIQVLYANKNASDNNDASLVLKLTYGNVSFMLMGDASKEIETQIAATYDVSAQILKAGHHGSNTSSGLNFMQQVNPKAVILSYGKDNSYIFSEQESPCL
ncbi:MBL fold metallo-hydrolase [Lysinibacillus sp. KU-BSD001]